MMRMWKPGLPANPLIIKPDRSLMAPGSQEAFFFSFFFFLFLPPFLYSAIKYPIYGIEPIAVSRYDAVIGV